MSRENFFFRRVATLLAFLLAIIVLLPETSKADPLLDRYLRRRVARAMRYIEAQFNPPWKGRYKERVTYSINTRGQKIIALTIDDGPVTNATTKQFCDVLKANRCEATFFMVGGRVHSHREDAQQALRSGMEVANHTWEHVELAGLSRTAIAYQIDKTENEMLYAFGYKPIWVRSRGGKWDYTSRAIAYQKGFLIAGWSIHGGDTNPDNSATAIKNKVLSQAKPGGIILLHQCPKTLQALPGILSGLKSRGYKVVGLSQLAQTGRPN